MKKYAAEFLGTYSLVMGGCGSVVYNDATNGSIGQIGIGIAFGVSVTAMILVFGKISGAHINPAVTIALWMAKKFEKKEILPYTLFQTAGAIAAGFTLKALSPTNEYLGTTLPAHSTEEAFVLELLLTFALMYVIMTVTSMKKQNAIFNACAIGMVVLLEAYFAGPLTGASMNPARSIGPAIASTHLEHLWLYIAAPITGAVAAVGTCKFTIKR